MNLKHVILCGALSVSVVAACGGGGSSDGEPSGGKGGTGGKSVTGGKGGTPGGGVAGKGGSSNGGSGGSSGGMGGSANGGSSGTGGSAAMTGAPKDGLIAYYPFDEGAGTSVKDASGNNNNGMAVEGGVIDSPVSATVSWSDGKKGKALTLDGTNDWVKVPRSDSIDTTGLNGAVTVGAWVKMREYRQAAANSAFNFLVCRQEVGTSHEHFGLAVLEGKPTAAVHFFFSTAADVIALDTWTHLAMTYDGITLVVYTNGVLSNTLDVGWPIAADTTPLTIGGAQNIDTVKEFVSGSLDEVYVYNRALDATEITVLMNAAN